jgi:hypothetical protein
MRDLFFLALLMLVSIGAQAQGSVRQKIVRVSDVYIPDGFRSDSNAYAIESGWFPNSCYKLDSAEVRDAGPFFHEVTTRADVRAGFCLAVIIVWHKLILFGRLQEGRHVLHFLDGYGTYLEKELTVSDL